MVFKRIGGWLERTVRAALHAADLYWKQWTKPDSDRLCVNFAIAPTAQPADEAWPGLPAGEMPRARRRAVLEAEPIHAKGDEGTVDEAVGNFLNMFR